MPILLPDTPNPDDADLDTADYDALWQVVRALRAHDDTFATGLDTCRGNGGRLTEESVQRHLTFSVPAAYSREFSQHLTVRIVNSASEPWWDGYAKLQDFNNEYGHVRVSPKHKERSYSLGSWVAHAREQYREGQRKTRGCIEQIGL